MAKKKQFVTAAAAFAVAASAVAPAITADAASTTVRLSSDYVRGGDLNAALDKEYKGSEIHWYKSSIDMNKLGVFQTAKGFVKGKGIKVEKKLRVLNYAQEIKPESEFVFEQGVPVSGIRVQPVLFADGVVYNKPLFVAGFSTEKVGEFEGTLTYSNKAYGSVTKTVKYKVVATKVELSEVKSEVMDDVLSVTADVKNLKDGEKVELVVYANRDMNAALPAVEAEVKDGKLSVKSAKLPAGNHSFILRSGEVKTEAMNFVVEAPMVKEVKAINAKKVVVEFNKEMNETSAEATGSYDFVGLTAGTTWTPELQADGKTVVLTLNNAIAADSTFVAIVNEVSTKADVNKKTEKFTKTINFSDTVKPTFTGVTYPEAGTAVLNFSEDLSTKGTVAVYDGSTDVTSSLTVTHAANSSKVSISGLTTDKEYKVVVVGAKDQSSNLIPAPIEVYVKSSISEQVKPMIESVSSVDTTTLKVKFSEKLKQITAGVYANISINGTAVTGETQTFDAETNTLTVTKTGLTTQGVQSVSIAGYKDLSNNTGDTLTKAVAFAPSAPVLEKTEVVKDATDTYVQLTFNETPNLAAIRGEDITGTYTTPENVLKTFGTAALDEATDITLVGNTLKIKVTGNEAGKYKLTIPAAGISDGTTARTENQVIEFTLAASADTAKPAVNNVYLPGENAAAVGQGTVARNVVYVKYSKNMDSSAVNADNYMVDGQRLFDSAVFVGDKTLVKLTLKESGVTLSGDRSFQITTAVKGENGVAINSFSNTEPFVENVKPVLSSGIVVDGTNIDVTFTEAVVDAQLVGAGVGNDFEVYIDGVKSTLASVGTGATANDSKLRLVLATGITPAQLSGSTITVKVLDTTDGTDSNLNPLTKGTVITLAK
ncbi:hypothetical protein [Exiguobacterium sp. s181]|uniref:hypothetical protein n=2 Tax=Bacillales Family XII. Incertae Sedis TaxID=539742 RepID=UPI001BEBD61F|nr:hypothetical protein [Exiguobacterium sp. s181]